MESKEQIPAGPPTEETPFKRRGRIVVSLLAVLVFVGLAPLATVAWKLIVVNREALTTAQQEYQLLLASGVAHDLDTQVEALTSQLVRVAQTLGATVGGGGAIPRDEVEALLAAVAEDPVLYLRYSYSDERGGRSIAAGALPDVLASSFRIALQETVENLSYGAAGSADLAVLSRPLLWEADTPRMVVVVSAPVTVEGRLRGVLTAVADLQSIWDGITRRILTGHVIYALDESGRVVASTDAQQVQSGGDASRSELVRRFVSGEGRARETMPYVEIRPSGEEERFMGSYAATDEGWGVFVRARQREVFRPVQSMVETSVTWAVAALALAALAAVFFARSLSSPINRLAHASRAFATGDFSTRVQSRSRNEIGELAHTFNRMAQEIELHIERLRRAAEENNELFLGTVRALAQAIDAKDPYTRGHSVRVNRYAVIIAREMGLDEKQIRDIHVASLMHDVGKIGILDTVLNKPGKLTPEEFELMKTHTTLGASIMSPIPQMKDIIPGLRSHHERWKGGGYPDGLEGEGIPLMARIIAVADTFDAVTTTRPYQKTMTMAEALQVINRLKGEALDERVVEAFYRAIRAGRIRLERKPVAPVAEQPPPLREAVNG